MNMKTTTKVIAAVLFLCLPLAALGAPPTGSHTKAAEDLFLTMKLETLMTQTVDTMIKAQVAQNPEMKKVEGVLREFFTKYMGWKTLKPPMIAIYTETFTEAELREINAFYRTPTGQKAITVMPALIQKGAAIGQKLVQDHIGELQANIQAKLKADGAKKP
jgi:hypothetical protein